MKVFLRVTHFGPVCTYNTKFPKFQSGAYETCFSVSATGLITFTVSALWQCALYQMKAGSFPSRHIPNILIYYANVFGNIAYRFYFAV